MVTLLFPVSVALFMNMTPVTLLCLFFPCSTILTALVVMVALSPVQLFCMRVMFNCLFVFDLLTSFERFFMPLPLLAFDLEIAPLPVGEFAFIVRRPGSPVVFSSGVEKTALRARVFGSFFLRAALLEGGYSVPRSLDRYILHACFGANHGV